MIRPKKLEIDQKMHRPCSLDAEILGLGANSHETPCWRKCAKRVDCLSHIHQVPTGCRLDTESFVKRW